VLVSSFQTGTCGEAELRYPENRPTLSYDLEGAEHEAESCNRPPLSPDRPNDAGLAHLKGLYNLTELYLGSTQLTGAGLAHLKGLTKLSMLHLVGSPVTDTGLAHLKRLTRLRALYVQDTLVTDVGVNELQRAFPGLRIYR
jgi:hypothetical protein